MKSLTVLAMAAVTLAIASAASATTIYGPTVKAHARIVNDRVNVILTIVPHYHVSKPGVQVTLTNCRLGQQTPLKVVSSPALMDGNYDLTFKPGKAIWKIGRTPALPDTAMMKLALALPHGKTGPEFCFHVRAHDNYTGKGYGYDIRVPIPVLTGSTINP